MKKIIFQSVLYSLISSQESFSLTSSGPPQCARLTSAMRNNELLYNVGMTTYWELEKELIEQHGLEKVNEALAQLEEDLGQNGFDAYRSGEHDLLLNYFEQ